MTGRRQYLAWALGVTALFCAYEIHSSMTAPLIIAEAVKNGAVNAQIKASGVGGNAAVITLTRPSGTSGEVTVIVPSGTVLYGGNPDGQRLMTAVPVRFVLSDGKPSVSSRVVTYCIDEFAVTPLDASVLSFVPPNEETEPFHKLADCIQSQSVSVNDKQLAVWAVKQDWLSKSQNEVLRFVTDGIVEEMSRERHEVLRRKMLELQGVTRLLSEEYLKAAIEKDFQNGMPECRDVAARQASGQLASFLKHGKDILSSCGYATENNSLFQ
jgi:hypothetical protein